VSNINEFGFEVAKLLFSKDAVTLHQPLGVAFTTRVRATYISLAGIKQPWTAVSVVLDLVGKGTALTC